MSLCVSKVQNTSLVQQTSRIASVPFCGNFATDTVEFSNSGDEKLLFPDGIGKFTMSQGDFGDCQLVSTLDAICRNTKGEQIIRDMVKLNPDKKSIDVYLAFNDGKPVNVSIEVLNKERETIVKKRRSSILRKIVYKMAYWRSKNEDWKDNPKSGERPLGIQAIEHAYAKALYEKYPDKYKSGNPKDVYNSDNYHSNACQAAIDITGVETKYIVSADNLEKVPVGKSKAKTAHPSLASAPEDRKNEVINILNDFSDNPEKYSITACTTDAPDIMKYIGWHDYSIRAYDKATKTITFVNPWNTGNEKKCDLTEFLNNFESISCTKY